MSVYLWELRKLRAQRRTLIGLVVALLIPAAFAIGLAVSPAKPPTDGQIPDPDVFISLAYNTSGLVLPFICLFFSSLVLIPLLAALVAGDIVAAEDGNNTLKTVLTRSTSRLRLLSAKIGATFTYVMTLLIVFGISSTAIGAVAGGVHSVPLGGVPLGAGFTLGQTSIGVGPILGRIALGLLDYAPPLLAVSAWGFMLSTVTRNSGASIVGMLVFSFANQIIGFLPNVPPAVTRWLLTDQFTSWQAVLGTSIDTAPMLHSLVVSIVYLTPPLLFSAWWFQRRDVLV
jgi:ABC-2 type transport system permease protein